MFHVLKENYDKKEGKVSEQKVNDSGNNDINDIEKKGNNDDNDMII